MEDRETEQLKDIVESEVALGKYILGVDSDNACIQRPIYTFKTVIEKDEKTGKDVEKEVLVGVRIELVPTPFKEPMNPDITRANLDQDDMRIVQALYQSWDKTKNFAERYNKFEELAPAANWLADTINSIVVPSRAKDFRGAILSKSTIHVEEAKSKQWVSQFGKEDTEGKKKWGIF